MAKVNFYKIKKRFKEISGLDLSVRRTNFFDEGIERKDNLFESLSRLYFDQPEKIGRLKKEITNWVQEEESETVNSLAGYIFYMKEDFKKAKGFFLKAVSLNPDNFDNWRDLAFALRHLGEEDASYGILFNFDFVIHYFNYFGVKDSGYDRLKNLILEINRKAECVKNGE